LQIDNSEKELLGKVEKQKKTINDVGEMYSGIKAYEVGKGKPAQTEKIRDKKPYTSETRIDKNWKPFYDGKHIGRYELLWRENNWIKYGEWLAAPRQPENFEGEKILIRKITGKTLLATYIPETSYCNTLLFVLKLKDKQHSYKSVLALLNSTLIGWYFRKKFQISDDDTFPQIMIRDILQFPIPVIALKVANELEKLVDQLLQLNQEKQETKLASKAEQLQGKIDYCENRINQLVYQLYELTEEEVKMIEKK
jgi:adenine-specific DNA-methyltransferase